MNVSRYRASGGCPFRQVYGSIRKGYVNQFTPCLIFFGELAERPSDPALSQRYVLFELNIDGASQLKY
jgi:hypothetical protein